jgi:hypothetical protein
MAAGQTGDIRPAATLTHHHQHKPLERPVMTAPNYTLRSRTQYRVVDTGLLVNAAAEIAEREATVGHVHPPVIDTDTALRIVVEDTSSSELYDFAADYGLEVLATATVLTSGSSTGASWTDEPFADVRPDEVLVHLVDEAAQPEAKLDQAA